MSTTKRGDVKSSTVREDFKSSTVRVVYLVTGTDGDGDGYCSGEETFNITPYYVSKIMEISNPRTDFSEQGVLSRDKYPSNLQSYYKAGCTGSQKKGSWCCAIMQPGQNYRVIEVRLLAPDELKAYQEDPHEFMKQETVRISEKNMGYDSASQKQIDAALDLSIQELRNRVANLFPMYKFHVQLKVGVISKVTEKNVNHKYDVKWD
jgi:hypothetical protein